MPGPSGAQGHEPALSVVVDEFQCPWIGGTSGKLRTCLIEVYGVYRDLREAGRGDNSLWQKEVDHNRGVVVMTRRPR